MKGAFLSERRRLIIPGSRLGIASCLTHEDGGHEEGIGTFGLYYVEY
jgi:hypothetical protein